jgi:decaprenyl-diphosphate synthase subunit 1
MAVSNPFRKATQQILARDGAISLIPSCTWTLDNVFRSMSTFKGPSSGYVERAAEQRRNVHHNLAFTSDPPVNNPPRKQFDVMKSLVSDIHHSLKRSDSLLNEMAVYYFNGEGKFIRPRLTGTMAGAVNCHLGLEDEDIERKQRIISMVSEMWHTSSLVHDDVIDHAESRRGFQSVNDKWGVKRSIFTGDYVLAVSVKLLADTRNPKVIETMSQILSDLVNGEFQQMGNRMDDEDRFQLYLDKTFNKTASLMAYSCKSVAELAVPETMAGPSLPNMAFMYGQNIGLAFQLIDDWLDFVSSADQLGKPAGADLQLGLATAPVLFASKQFPHLKDLILRQFRNPGDVERAFETVLKSSGLDETKRFAKEYATKAISDISELRESSYKEELRRLAESTVERCS